MPSYIAHFRLAEDLEFGVLAQRQSAGLDSDSASESLLSMLDSAIRWPLWSQVLAISIRTVEQKIVFAISGSDSVLRSWEAQLTQRQKSDWPPVATRDDFDSICDGDQGWESCVTVKQVRGYAVPDFGACDEIFRDRALFDERAALVHFTPLVLGAAEFRTVLSNLQSLEDESAYGLAHKARLKALIERPLNQLVACALLVPSPAGEADGLVYEREAAFPQFPHDAYCQALTPTELRRKAAVWFAPSALGNSESVMSRLSKIETRLEELGRGRYLAGNLRRAFGVRQMGEAEAATKARRIAESIATRVLRAESGKRVSKPFKDIIETLAQMPHTRIPPSVIAHLDGARRIGNRGAHADELDRPDVDARDVEVALLQVLNLVEWYLFEYDRAG